MEIELNERNRRQRGLVANEIKQFRYKYTLKIKKINLSA